MTARLSDLAVGNTSQLRGSWKPVDPACWMGLIGYREATERLLKGYRKGKADVQAAGRRSQLGNAFIAKIGLALSQDGFCLTV